LTEAGVPHEVTIYEGQPHAFVKDAAGIKAGGAPGQAWEQMLAFLEENLKNSATGTNELSLSDYRAPFAWKYYVVLVYEHAFGMAGQIH
jgi:hypothetical protein